MHHDNLGDLIFEQLTSAQFPLAKHFYKSARYSSKIGREDEVYVLRQSSESNAIIASVRLIKLDRFLILRSMVVSQNKRQEGIGTILLNHLCARLSSTKCWCFPFEHLYQFYSDNGFECIPPEACPVEIRQKYQQYLSQGRKLLLMRAI